MWIYRGSNRYVRKKSARNPKIPDYLENFDLEFATISRFANSETAFSQEIELTLDSTDLWHHKATVFAAIGEEKRAARCFRNTELFSWK